jgi:hypothetical protein
LQILPKGAISVTAKISPHLQEYMPHAGLTLLATINDQFFLQFHSWWEFYVSFSFSLSSAGYSVFVGFEAMFRRKSTSPAKPAVCREETRRRLRLWAELGKIGGIANLWRFADFMCRDMATVSLLATLHFLKVA